MTAKNSLSTTCGPRIDDNIETSPTKLIELSETFYINNQKKNNVKIQVKLNNDGIYLRRETAQSNHINEQLIRIEDIIGSRCGPRQRKRTRGGLSSCKGSQSPDQRAELTSGQKDTSAYIYIYAYVKTEKPLQRNRTIRILRFRSFDTYEENLKAAERWHQCITYLIRPQHSVRAASMQDQKTQLLILLNPKSGMGKGREMFQKQVAPVLQEAEVPYELQVTTHANYAREFVRRRQGLLQQYSGIVVAAGDGLFFEVLNGLMERDDWDVVRSMPLGIIPCGSGNGLARSIAHLYNEPYEPKPILHATLACVSGKTARMDAVRIELAKGDKHTEMYSFLSVGWGLIADIDIESERLRSIGAPRFTLWSIHRLISLRTYKGKLSYLPWRKEHAEASSVKPKERIENPPQRKDNESKFYDPDEEVEEDVEFRDANDDFVDAVSFRSHIDSWHSSTSRRTAYYSIAGNSQRSRVASISQKIEAANAELNVQTPPATIPPLNMPLPTENWHCEEGEYVMIHAAYTTHLASDCFFVPESRLNDGVIYLVIIRGGVSRSQLLHFLLGLSSASHMPEQPNEFIQQVAVSAFRIEPSGEEGIIAVDGERVDYGAIQGEILPGLFNVMVPNRT